MNDRVVSEVNAFYFVKLAFVGLIYLFIFGYPIYSVVNYGHAYTLYKRILVIVFCLGFLIVFIVKFLKDFKKLTITDEYIMVKYFLTQKKIIIKYPDIKRLSTTRQSGDGEKYNALNYQNFTIEFGNNKSIVFNTKDYINFDDIKSSIYAHKVKFE